MVNVKRLIVLSVVLLAGLMVGGCAPNFTPEFLRAVVNGEVTTIKSILQEHPEWVNARDKYGRTPLHEAVQNGNKEVVELLVTRGADVNAKNKINKCNPLCMIVGLPLQNTEEHKEIAEYLITNGASTRECKGSFLCRVLIRGWYDLAKLAIDKGANVNEKDRDGNTPLHFANNKEENREFTELLITMGADVNAKNKYGVTPLYEAVRTRGGRANIVELLIANGAKVNVKTKKGETPLNWANEYGHTEIADLLRKHGAVE